MCRIEELCRKDVINIRDGCRLGFVDDVEIDLTDGRVCSLVIYGKNKFFGLFGREDDICVPWESIDKIGEDIILVCYDGVYPRHAKHKSPFGFFH